jgi:hypothetical protein
MQVPSSARHGLILVRDSAELGGDDRRLRADHARGELVRLARGVYVVAERWEACDPREQHVLRARAFASTAVSEHVFSHATAAAVHGVPVIGGYPVRVHVTVEPGSGARFRQHVVPHRTALPPAHVERVNGLLVTTPARTVVDLATSESFPAAVAAVDWWLGERGDRASLQQLLDSLPRRTGGGRAEQAIEFGSARSGSVGESISRAAMHVLRLPPPRLQQRFEDEAGTIGIVDFWWPHDGLIGEFDGVAKYVRLEYAKGRTPAEVVIEEKRREDRLRSLGHRVVRWGWQEATDLNDLDRVLTAAGLRRV